MKRLEFGEKSAALNKAVAESLAAGCIKAAGEAKAVAEAMKISMDGRSHGHAACC